MGLHQQKENGWVLLLTGNCTCLAGVSIYIFFFTNIGKETRIMHGLQKALCIVLIFFVPIINGKICKLSEHSIKTESGYNKCVSSIECPPGTGLSHEVGNVEPYPVDVNIECTPCKNGTFSDSTSSSACQNCRPECDKDEIEKPGCVSTQDRFCICKPGHYRNTGTGKCTDECCYCSKGDSVVKECADLNDGRNCGSIRTKGKCAVKTTVASSTAPTQKPVPTETNKSHKNDWIIGIVVGVLVCILVTVGLVYYREQICQEFKSCFVSVDENSSAGLIDQDGISGQSNRAELEVQLVSRMPSLEDICNAVSPMCIEGCQNTFTQNDNGVETNILLSSVTGSKKVTVCGQFNNVSHLQMNGDLQKMVTTFKLSNRSLILTIDDFLQALDVQYPEFLLQSFVWLMKKINRNDVVIIIHNLYHERRA